MLTREEILARKTGKGKAVLPDGSEVSVRGLTRNEVMRGNAMTDEERENYFLSCGLLDPALSVEDVAAWADSADAGDLVAVSDRIAVLSGLRAGADKS